MPFSISACCRFNESPIFSGLTDEPPEAAPHVRVLGGAPGQAWAYPFGRRPGPKSPDGNSLRTRWTTRGLWKAVSGAAI